MTTKVNIDSEVQNEAFELGQKRLEQVNSKRLPLIGLENFAQTFFTFLSEKDQNRGIILWGFIVLYLQEKDESKRNQLKNVSCNLISEFQNDLRFIANVELTYLLAALEGAKG